MTFKTLAATVALSLMASSTAALATEAVVTTQLNVRDGPGTRYAVIDVLYRGDVVEVEYCEGTWCHVDKSGPNGWVSAKYLASDRYYDDDDYYYEDDDYYYEDDYYYDDDVGVEFWFGNHFPRRVFVPDYYEPPVTNFPTLHPDGSPIFRGNNGGCMRMPDGALVC